MTPGQVLAELDKENVTARLRKARANLDASRAARTQLLISRAKVEEAKAQVAQAQAAVERAEEELANATIRRRFAPRSSRATWSWAAPSRRS